MHFSQWAERKFRFCFGLFIYYILNRSQRTVSQLDLCCSSSSAVAPRHCLTDSGTSTRMDEPRDCYRTCAGLFLSSLLQKLLREALRVLRSQWKGEGEDALCLVAEGPGKTLLLIPGASSPCQRPPAPCAVPRGSQISRKKETTQVTSFLLLLYDCCLLQLLCRHSLSSLAE